MTQGRIDRRAWFNPVKEFLGVDPSYIQEALNELVNDTNGIFYQAAPGFVGSYGVNSLPTFYPRCSWAYAVDGFKVGETYLAGGTGVPAYYDASWVWRTFSSDQPVRSAATTVPSYLMQEDGVSQVLQEGGLGPIWI